MHPQLFLLRAFLCFLSTHLHKSIILVKCKHYYILEFMAETTRKVLRWEKCRMQIKRFFSEITGNELRDLNIGIYQLK